MGLPPHVTAMTGVDAFVHAMESYVGKADTLMTDALNLQAMRLIARSIRRAYVDGQDHEVRADMLYASALAGMGFSNTQNGIIHAVGTAVPREYHLPHGLLMACLSPMCMEFSATTPILPPPSRSWLFWKPITSKAAPRPRRDRRPVA